MISHDFKYTNGQTYQVAKTKKHIESSFVGTIQAGQRSKIIVED